MTCVLPPELEDRDLLTYLDGEAGYEILVHIDRCPYCRDRAARLARLQGRLTAGLYRADCPSPHELGEYHLDMLPASQRKAIETHLAGCPHCVAEVAQLRDYVDALAPDITPGRLDQAARQIRVLFARLVAGGQTGLRLGPPALAPAYATVRGAAEGPLVYQAGDVQIAVEVQDDCTTPGGRALLGLVSGADTQGWTARLEQAGEPAATAPVDELGNFVLAAIAPGIYDLVIAAPDLEIHIESLDIAGP